MANLIQLFNTCNHQHIHIYEHLWGFLNASIVHTNTHLLHIHTNRTNSIYKPPGTEAQESPVISRVSATPTGKCIRERVCRVLFSLNWHQEAGDIPRPCQVASGSWFEATEFAFSPQPQPQQLITNNGLSRFHLFSP